MSATSPVFLNKSALDIQITFKSASMQTPVSLNVGNGSDEIMTVDVSDNIQYDMTATGDVSIAVMPVKVTGKITLHPQSPAIQALQQVNASYTSLLVVPGIISVSSASGGWGYSFNNVVISSPFKGYDVRKVVSDYTYTFFATLPNITTLYTLTNASAGLVNIL